MLRNVIIILLSGIFLLAPGMYFNLEDSAYGAELSSNIMRRINAANDYLDKAEEQIRTGRAEHAPRQLSGAQQEYENIFNYYKGSFDPQHPTLMALKGRIDAVTAALSAGSAPAGAQSAASSQPAQKTQVQMTQQSVSSGPQGSAATGSQPLLSNIVKRLDKANRALDAAFANAAKGRRADMGINIAKEEYSNILNYYPGRIDSSHPQMVALKNRIEEAEQADKQAQAAVEEDKQLNIETNPRVVGDLPPEVGKALLLIGEDLAKLENNLAIAESSSNPENYVVGLKDSLERLKINLEKFQRQFTGQISPVHTAYVQVQNRFAIDAAAVSKVEHRSAGAIKAQRDAEASDAEARRIMGKYSNQEPTSRLHSQNVGKMVWATELVGFKAQDNIATKNSFRLTDPIFGRVYLIRSIGNTPVYSQSGGKASENYEYGYVVRLYIDGKEKTDKFGVFTTSKLNGQAGETWTTFQFAPNPVPFDNDFRNEAEAWRRVTKGLSPGTHTVRFELWGEQGQFRSKQPLSVGEFSLIVGEGDRVAAGMKFPEDTYRGSDVNTVRDDMLKALVGPVAKNRSEILKISVTSDWRPGIYTDSKRPYRKISGTVLWYDENNDNVCRFTTVNFISDSLGGSSWTPVRYGSFTVGQEGDTECP